MRTVDLAAEPLRELNAALHRLNAESNERRWRVLNPRGAHALAVGIDAPVEVEIEGHAGYYCAGMNKQATVRVHGNVGVGCAENIMSGAVIVDGVILVPTTPRFLSGRYVGRSNPKRPPAF